MNIFVTDTDLKIAASHLDDKRVVKMILESAQMLCGAVRYHGISHPWIYKKTHESHPCSQWARESKENFDWLVEYALELCKIYTAGYGRVHGSQAVIERISSYRSLFKSKGLTPFANCSGYSVEGDPDFTLTDAYKLCLDVKWHEKDVRSPTWKNRPIPSWYDQETRDSYGKATLSQEIQLNS